MQVAWGYGSGQRTAWNNVRMEVIGTRAYFVLHLYLEVPVAGAESHVILLLCFFSPSHPLLNPTPKALCIQPVPLQPWKHRTTEERQWTRGTHLFC